MSIVLFKCVEHLLFQFGLHVWVEHNTQQHCAFVEKVPPAPRRFLQSRSHIKRMTCLWWQLTHNITIHSIRLSMEDCWLQINVKNVSTLAGCHFAEARESVCWYSFCLSLRPLNTHLAFALKKLPCLYVLTVSTHLPVTKFLALTFLRSTRSKTSLSTQDLPSQCFASANWLYYPLTSSVEASFPARDFLFAFSCCLSAGCHTLFQHISSSTVNSFWNFNLYVTWTTSLILEPRSWPEKVWWNFTVIPLDAVHWSVASARYAPSNDSANEKFEKLWTSMESSS